MTHWKKQQINIRYKKRLENFLDKVYIIVGLTAFLLILSLVS
jgi:hypothetical protein